MNGHAIARLAAEKEPAVVFPPFYFGQIYEARCFPGTVTIRPTLLVDLIQGVFDEIGRNGFKKIVIYNAHGGNTRLLEFMAQCSLWEEKPYCVYLQTGRLSEEEQEEWRKIARNFGHGCDAETSISLANHEELVHMDRVPESGGKSLERLAHVPRCRTGVTWYSNHPEHYAGDARPATVEKGRALRQLIVDSLANFIKAVKNDDVAPTLQKEFFDRVRQVGKD
jgi:creatinine amidohydrolase